MTYCLDCQLCFELDIVFSMIKEQFLYWMILGKKKQKKGKKKVEEVSTQQCR